MRPAPVLVAVALCALAGAWFALGSRPRGAPPLAIEALPEVQGLEESAQAREVALEAPLASEEAVELEEAPSSASARSSSTVPAALSNRRAARWSAIARWRAATRLSTSARRDSMSAKAPTTSSASTTAATAASRSRSVRRSKASSRRSATARTSSGTPSEVCSAARSAARSCTAVADSSCQPTSALPVKLNIFRRKSERSPATCEWSKGITFICPAGIPASCKTSASNNAESGVRGEGLSTIVLPLAKQGATLWATRFSGKLNGVIPAVTPSG